MGEINGMGCRIAVMFCTIFSLVLLLLLLLFLLSYIPTLRAENSLYVILFFFLFFSIGGSAWVGLWSG